MAIEDLIANGFNPGTPDTWDAARLRAAQLAGYRTQQQGDALKLKQLAQQVADDQARREDMRRMIGQAMPAPLAQAQQAPAPVIASGAPMGLASTMSGQPAPQPAPAPQQAPQPQAAAPAIPMRGGAVAPNPASYEAQTQALIDAAQRRGDYTYASGLYGDLLKRKSELSTIGMNNAHAQDFGAQAQKANVETSAKQAEMTAGALKATLEAPPEQQQAVFAREMQGLAQRGVITPEQAQEQFPGADVLQQHYAALVPALTRIQQQNEAAKGQREAALAPAQLDKANAEAEQAKVLSAQYQSLGKTKEQADVLAQTALRDRQNAANQAGHLAVARAELGVSQARQADTHKLIAATQNDAVLDSDARDFMRGVPISQIVTSRGNAGQARIDQIKNRAAELAKAGGTVVDHGSAMANFGADKGSLAKLQSSSDQVNAFEGTALKNLDLFTNTAKQVMDSGSPAINMPLRVANEKMFGSTDQTAFNTARQIALTEVAKVLTNPGANGVLSDSARHEVGLLIGPNATLAQVYKAANILKQDMQNRRDSNAKQIAAIKERISGPQQQKSSAKNNDPLGIR